MQQLDSQEEIIQIVDRLEKLSIRPENPGVAYRNLENISALTHVLKDKLGFLSLSEQAKSESEA
jgi:hypothetical protein